MRVIHIVSNSNYDFHIFPLYLYFAKNRRCGKEVEYLHTSTARIHGEKREWTEEKKSQISFKEVL